MKDKSLANQLLRGSLPRNIEAVMGRPLSHKQVTGPSYIIDFNAASIYNSNVVSAGVISVATDIANPTALVSSWSTRWAACFREYRVLGVRISSRFTNLGASSSGECWAWVDEKSSTAPTSAEALSSRHAVIPLYGSSPQSGMMMARVEWVADDLSDLSFQQTSTGFSPIYFKRYASAGVTGFNSTSVSELIEVVLRIEFRGVLG